MDEQQFDQLSRRLSRRVVIGSAVILAIAPQYTPAKKRKRCKPGRFRCGGTCFKRNRTICCPEAYGRHETGYPGFYACCPLTDEDQLGGGCPAPGSCCRAPDGSRICVPPGFVCCPQGGSCPVDYPISCDQSIQGQPICTADAFLCQFN